jgi:hypothetical protein
MRGQADSLLPIQFRFFYVYLGANCSRFSGIVIPAFAFISPLRYEDIGSIGAKLLFIFVF